MPKWRLKIADLNIVARNPYVNTHTNTHTKKLIAYTNVHTTQFNVFSWWIQRQTPTTAIPFTQFSVLCFVCSTSCPLSLCVTGLECLLICLQFAFIWLLHVLLLFTIGPIEEPNRTFFHSERKEIENRLTYSQSAYSFTFPCIHCL